MRKTFLMLTVLVTILGCSSLASADPWVELGDAGQLPGTAQSTSGTNPLTSISGSLSSPTDVDMYLIFITGGGTFSASTVGGTSLDTQLYLFNAGGFGVYHNDDQAGCLCLQSTLPAGHALTPLAPGFYYLAISNFDNDPLSAGGYIFPFFPSDGVHGPTGSGGGQPITSWDNFAFSGTGGYTITLTGAQFANGAQAIPEPATMLLLGTGLAGIAAGIRNRRKTRS